MLNLKMRYRLMQVAGALIIFFSWLAKDGISTFAQRYVAVLHSIDESHAQFLNDVLEETEFQNIHKRLANIEESVKGIEERLDASTKPPKKRSTPQEDIQIRRIHLTLSTILKDLNSRGKFRDLERFAADLNDMTSSMHIEGPLRNKVNAMYSSVVSLQKRYSEEVDNMRKYIKRLDTVPSGTIVDKVSWIAMMEAERQRQNTAVEKLLEEVSESHGQLLALFGDLAQEMTRRLNKYKMVAGYADILSYFFYIVGSALALAGAWNEAQVQSTRAE